MTNHGPSARSYYWESCKRFGQECYRTWRQELAIGVVIAGIAFLLTYRDKSALEQFLVVVEATAIVFALFVLFHLARTPFILHYPSSRTGSPTGLAASPLEVRIIWNCSAIRSRLSSCLQTHKTVVLSTGKHHDQSPRPTSRESEPIRSESFHFATAEDYSPAYTTTNFATARESYAVKQPEHGAANTARQADSFEQELIQR